MSDGGKAPPEKLLQAIWQQQRIYRDRLTTLDGRRLRVLHPGFISREGGPDFRKAVLQWQDEPPVFGDVEIDLQAAGWRAHGHDQNPAFENVRLQVVWEPPGKISTTLPILSLADVLDCPLAELAATLDMRVGLPEAFQGQCSAPLRGLSQEQISALLEAASLTRFQNRAQAILARSRQAGWESTFWEFLFRALGYKHNAWPMQRLAETRPAWDHNLSAVWEYQARLLGLSGLLPPELTQNRPTSNLYIRKTWDAWWRERDAHADHQLPRSIWHLQGLRPANHPQRRLALAAHWLANPNLIARIENWATSSIAQNPWDSPSAAHTQHDQHPLKLMEILQVIEDEFWSWHWTFKSPRLEIPQPLLGEARLTDLAINVILPWLWVRAREGGNALLMREMEARYLTWPASEDNARLKMARQRLLGSRPPTRLRHAFEQQGLLQIMSDFCDQSNSLCDHCIFPEMIRSLHVCAQDQSKNDR